MKILHVEDNESLAKSYKMRVQDEYPGVEIEHAATYDEAVQRLKEERFDLIVSDFSFPGKDVWRYSGGVDLYRFVLEGKIETPVHFLSSMAAHIEDILAKNHLPLRPTDKLFSKGTQRAIFEAFGLSPK